MTNPRVKRPRSVHGARYKFMLRRLIEARKLAGLTQAEAAKQLSRPQSFVSKCELGERRMDPIDLQDFAHLYGKRVAYFLPPSE